MMMAEHWNEQQRDPPPGLVLLLSALDRGELVFSNHAATDPAELDGPARPGVMSYRRGGRRFERRALAFDTYGTTYIIEVVRELH